MAGRTPFELRVLRPGDWPEGFGVNLRHLVLHEFEGFGVAELGITAQKVQSTRARAEAVHQQKAQPDRVTLSEVENLLNDEIEKGEPFFHRKQRFGALETHACA